MSKFATGVITSVNAEGRKETVATDEAAGNDAVFRELVVTDASGRTLEGTPEEVGYDVGHVKAVIQSHFHRSRVGAGTSRGQTCRYSFTGGFEAEPTV